MENTKKMVPKTTPPMEIFPKAEPLPVDQVSVSEPAYVETLTTPPTYSLSIEQSIPHKKLLSSNLAASTDLGNHLFELSALLAISRKLERIPAFFIADYYHEQMLKDADFLMPGLLDHFLVINQSIPTYIIPVDFHMKCCIWDDPDRLKEMTDEHLHIKGTHFQSWIYFSGMQMELKTYLKAPSNTFSDLPKSNENTFITCVHIRRTDFVGSGFYVPDEKFILSSMQVVEKKEGRKKRLNMYTVFFGDDIDFLENISNQTFTLSNGKIKNLNVESFISRDNPTDSILYSRHHCDVVLITAPRSTFGWWMGYLSKGNQVYYTDIKFVDDVSILTGTFNPDDYYPPHWTSLKYNEFDNITIVKTME